ncbi:hypothetical protein QE417_002451 [Mucilaginibacter terrae]|uniref:Uncharacterized protein n=1 Tax=Mucilaginibacter terrae TaxID=1955052 RepID=A0ABU3GUC7_9SPHI|nr:hypothetical protein [Mucilaginibacter terrae]
MFCLQLQMNFIDENGGNKKRLAWSLFLFRWVRIIYLVISTIGINLFEMIQLEYSKGLSLSFEMT